MPRPDDKSAGAQPDRADGKTAEELGDLKRRLDALDEALDQQKAAGDKAAGAGKEGSTASGVANAFKLSSEFVAGVVAGAGIGYVLDTLAGTTPWGLIIFLLLGFVAGVLNVLRSAGHVSQPDERLK